MNQHQTKGIVLRRTDYGEADRILTVLTPDYGKLRLMAKGVRRVKSKLAGGIELFSISQLSFIRGRGEIGTLVSARLDQHFGRIVHDIVRVQLGYDLIKILNTATEDEPDAEYFTLLVEVFQALDELDIPGELIRLWFEAQLLKLGGHSPNLHSDTSGQKLQPEDRYSFNFEAMAFMSQDGGSYGADHIKFLRLMFSGNPPRILQKVASQEELALAVAPIVRTMLNTFIRI